MPFLYSECSARLKFLNFHKKHQNEKVDKKLDEVVRQEQEQFSDALAGREGCLQDLALRDDASADSGGLGD